MTSPVVTFIDSVTESDIYDDYSLSISNAISILNGKTPNNIDANIANEIRNLAIQELGEDYKEKYKEDMDELGSVLEASNEFSNLGRLLGFNQGIPATRDDLLRKIDQIQTIFTERVNNKLSTLSKNKPDEAELIKRIEDFGLLDVYKYTTDPEYKKEVIDIYDACKIIVNPFAVLDAVPQFKVPVELFGLTLCVNNEFVIKNKVYNAVHDKIKQNGGKTSDKFKKGLLNSIQDEIITQFVCGSDLKIPIKAGDSYLTTESRTKTASEDSCPTINDKSGIAQFKYFFENVFIPNLALGKVYTIGKNGKPKVVNNTSLRTNPLISNLIKANFKGVPFYKANLNMLSIDKNWGAQYKFLNYIRGLKELSTIAFKEGSEDTSLSVADMFVLYNLVVNKNNYGESRMTTLLEAFLNKGFHSRLLDNYFSWISHLDYFGQVVLNDAEVENVDPKDILRVNYFDIVAGAAPQVKYEKGQTDPYIRMNVDGIEVLKEKRGRSYDDVGPLLYQETGEAEVDYLARVQNAISYNTLGFNYTNNLDEQLDHIIAGDKYALGILKEFVRKNLISIQSNC